MTLHSKSFAVHLLPSAFSNRTRATGECGIFIQHEPGLMPVITPRPTGHNAQRWSGIIGAMVVENKGFKGIHSNQHHLVHA
jgi:hypothetical protein